LLPGLFIVLFVTDLCLGSVRIPVGDVVNILLGRLDHEAWSTIIWDFRMTKALTCVLAGAALSVSGLQMQTLFRNALAGPDVLGISSGASLAVSLVFMGQSSGISLLSTANAWSLALAASLGCMVVFMLMLVLSARLKDNVSLLIVGLMVGAGTSSIVSVLQFISDADDLQTYMIWTFGSLGALDWSEIAVLSIALFVGTSIALLFSKSLNAWFLGERNAISLGIQVTRSRLFIILSSCILTGAVTAFCGPIAFVGLAVPHLIKMYLQTHDHRVLLPQVSLAGAIVLLICDIVAQLPGEGRILPVNAITALLGAPIVIWVIIRNRIVE
jgi:iron complex transport system permease protein